MGLLDRFLEVPGRAPLPLRRKAPAGPPKASPARLPAAGLAGVSSFDDGPAVKVFGIPRATGRASLARDVCYKLQIPLGARGTTATLERMAELAVEASQDGGFVQLARGIVRGCAPRAHECEGLAIYDHVLETVDYRNDPMFAEWVQSPGWTYLVEGQGDCDDQSSLIAALDLAVGRACRFGAYMLDREKAQAGEYSHVLCEMGIRTPTGKVKWLGQDTVAKQGFGWTPPESAWFGPPNYLAIAEP